MRIPFIARVDDVSELGIEPARFGYIRDTRGGSGFLVAGAAFWWVGALVSALWPGAAVAWVLYAGPGVPVVGWLICRLQGARISGHPVHSSLAGVAVLTELAALPTMFFLRDTHPEALPGILLIADGAHLLVLMWLHLDYTYFLAANLKVVLGVVFLFGGPWPGSYPPQLLVGGAISAAAAVLVWRDSSRTRSLYLRTGRPRRRASGTAPGADPS